MTCRVAPCEQQAATKNTHCKYQLNISFCSGIKHQWRALDTKDSFQDQQFQDTVSKRKHWIGMAPFQRSGTFLGLGLLTKTPGLFQNTMADTGNPAAPSWVLCQHHPYICQQIMYENSRVRLGLGWGRKFGVPMKALHWVNSWIWILYYSPH